ncbi:MAG: hypothetical protein WCI47_00550 [bacterium]
MIHRTLHSLKKLPSRVRTRLSHHLISPRAIASQLKLEEGDTVLELGSPIGFFTSVLLEEVGRPGRVIVAGPNQASFDRIGHLVSKTNVETVLLADVLLGRAFEHHSVDLVLLTNLLSSSMHPDHFCMSLNYFLRPGARIVLVDWEGAQPAGPDPKRRISKEQAVNMLSACGWTFESVLKTPGYHYGLVFRLKAR